MKKYRFFRTAIIAGALSLVNPVIVEAKEKTFFGYTEDQLKSSAKLFGSKLYDWCVEVDEVIQEKAVEPIKDTLSDIEIYAHDSLWLVTDMPSENPSEKRHYYFINKNTPSIKASYSYDKYGNKVDNDSPRAIKREQREMYVSLTDLETVFKIEYWLDLKTYQFTLNYQDFDEYRLYDEESDCKYGRFTSIEDIVPEELLKEKYSTKDLKEIEEYLNNLENTLYQKEALQLKKIN